LDKIQVHSINKAKHVNDNFKKQQMISVDKNLVEIELNIIQIYKINTIINL